MKLFRIITIVAITFICLLYAKRLLINVDQPTATDNLQIERLVLKGSNTIGEAFAPTLAISFLKEKGAILIRTEQKSVSVEKVVSGYLPKQGKRIQIEIYAHGSSTGFLAMTENSTDIAMSSRAIKPEEYKALSQTYGRVSEYPIALDALGIVSHQDIGVHALTIEQVAALFSGEIDNWKQLGGADEDVKLFARDDNSGTWDTFKHLVLKPWHKALSTMAKRFESSSELVAATVNTPGGIGFVGASYIQNVPLIRVSKSTLEKPSLPSIFTIGTMKYPLSRKLYLYSVRQKPSKLAADFLRFVNSNDGQANADKVGLVSYFPTQDKPPLSPDLPRKYHELASLGSRLTVAFSANSGFQDESLERRDLDRLAHYIHQYPNKKFVLVGINAKNRMQGLKQLFVARELPLLDTMQLGTMTDESAIEVWSL